MPALPFEQIVTKALLARFDAEAEHEGGEGRYYACILRDDGNLVAHHPYGPQLSPEQMLWTGDMLKRLNKELHHDGAWVAVFTHPHPLALGSSHSLYGRFVLMWLDKDGDVQFPYEWMEKESDMLDFAEVMLAGPHAILQQCEAAWLTWNHLMNTVLERKQGQTFKRARGERAPSAG